MQGALKLIDDFNQIAIQLNPLRAESVDSGFVWREMESAVTPDRRVDWQLLGNLKNWTSGYAATESKIGTLPTRLSASSFIFIIYGSVRFYRMCGWSNGELTRFIFSVIQHN